MPVPQSRRFRNIVHARPRNRQRCDVEDTTHRLGRHSDRESRMQYGCRRRVLVTNPTTTARRDRGIGLCATCPVSRSPGRHPDSDTTGIAIDCREESGEQPNQSLALPESVVLPATRDYVSVTTSDEMLGHRHL